MKFTKSEKSKRKQLITQIAENYTQSVLHELKQGSSPAPRTSPHASSTSVGTAAILIDMDSDPEQEDTIETLKNVPISSLASDTDLRLDTQAIVSVLDTSSFTGGFNQDSSSMPLSTKIEDQSRDDVPNKSRVSLEERMM